MKIKLLRYVAVVVFGMALLASDSAAAKQAGATPDEDVLQEFAALKAHINDLSRDQLRRGLRRALLAKLAAAKKLYSRGRVCISSFILKSYLNHTRAIRKRIPADVAETLFARGYALRGSLFDRYAADPSLRAPWCFRRRAHEPPRIKLVKSDNRRFAATVAFGGPRIWTVEGGGETWTQVELPGIETQGGVPGMPAIPVWRGLVAVPFGAEVTLGDAGSPVIAETLRVNLYPHQSEAADQQLPSIDPQFVNPPFSKAGDVYGENAFYPAQPCSIRPLGQYRDLQMAQVLCAAGQYNPQTDELRLFRSVPFEVDFEGGDGTFITSQSMSPFEEASASAVTTALNSAAVALHVSGIDISQLQCAGEELLILTHPNFRAAADDLAQWKRDKGIATSVINVGDGTPYTTGDAIDDLIESRYDECQVRLSYVLLLGDAEFVPPARTDYDTAGNYCGSCGDETTGSDWGYAIYPQSIFDVFFPDFGVARISVDTLPEAQTVVDKIVRYESDPPFVDWMSGGPFYTTAGLTGQFQCCRMNQDGSALDGQSGRAQRSFAETLEVGRDALTAAGKVGERIYERTVDNGGYCLVNENPCPAGQRQQAYTDSTIPNRYYNGSLLPPDLRSGSGFAWTGSTQDIVNAFNDGRFLIVHRDHGGSSGFSHPSFRTNDLPQLFNDELLPVVYSVNCASGYFDRETNTGGNAESLMEQLLFEPDGGMVSGLGDVRNSPTWANSALTRGFFDATWPNLAPEYGSAVSKRRIGDILNHGKVYMLTQVGAPQTAGSVSLEAAIAEYIIWHAYGDPTLEMWVSNPYSLILPLKYDLQILPDRMRVGYAHDGAVITALQRTEGGNIPVGRAKVVNGVAEIVYFHPPEPGVPVMLSASKENAVSVLLTPRSQEPDLVVQDLILPSVILFPGDDLAGVLGIKVGNLGGAVAAGTIDATGGAKPGYMVDLVLSSDTSMPAGFASVPQPPGESYAEDGLLQGGRVSRTPDVPGMTDLELPTAPPVSSDIGGTIPLQAPLGSQFLCARIDPGNVIAESDESNNVLCKEVTIQRRDITSQ